MEQIPFFGFDGGDALGSPVESPWRVPVQAALRSIK
jgi:hypothetical protein